MSDKEQPKLDIAIPVGVTREGNPIMARIQADSPGAMPRASVGAMIPVPAGEDVVATEDIVRLHPTGTPAYRVETLVEGMESRARRKGPSTVPTKKYTEGWERIFGSKPPSDMN